MKKIILPVILMVFVLFSANSQTYNPLEVNYTETWSNADVKELAQQIADNSFPRQKLEILQTAIADKPEGFTAEQTMMILKSFMISKYMAEAVGIMDDYIMGMNSKQVIEVLNELKFSSDKFVVLEALRSTITDKENKYIILDAFKLKRDKPKAKEILDRSDQPRSFIYGTVKSKNVIFAVDLSGSMSVEYEYNTGDTYSRLQFVKLELAKALLSLDDDCKFNIIFFESDLKIWERSMVKATESNVMEAIEYIRGLEPMGATNIYDALETAFKFQGISTIYFLTDGTPTSGQKMDTDDILADVKMWNNGRGVKINSTAFLTGEFSGDDKPASRSFMRKLAVATSGVYRSIE